MQLKSFFAIALTIRALTGLSQNFYFGADLSYVNEMEDCGVVYTELGKPKDLYQIFADHDCNLVRLRLWHTPAWYDTLNTGKRYSDFRDLCKSIQRARSAEMKVLLDFQLSDTWADPNRQLAPFAWQGVLDNLPVLKDSLYNYVYNTLFGLDRAGLLPEMVQIGNETNRGILLSPKIDGEGWSLDWHRNSQLFNRAIQAVRDVEKKTGKTIKIAVHIAGPADAGWLVEGLWSHGVTDFDIIGLSYYWAWHKPTSIEDAGNVVSELLKDYRGKAVMIFETGYIWTNQWNDDAPNIITEVHHNYAPASVENQRKWLIDMTQEVMNRGATGVLYWEPAWQSSPCRTPWGKGSHQEHATYFDFQNNLLEQGGIDFMTHAYPQKAFSEKPAPFASFTIRSDKSQRKLSLKLKGFSRHKSLEIKLLDKDGVLKSSQIFNDLTKSKLSFPIPVLPAGLYYCAVYEGEVFKAMRGVGLKKL